MTALLALDFDGVICDALEECALVSWLGEHEPPAGLTGPELLAAVPAGFVDRFRVVRNYSRLLEHFVVAHEPGSGDLATQAEFDAVFAALPEARVRAFHAAATAARQRLREAEPDFWFGLHTLYPGIPQLLRRFGESTVVVTAKDAESVRAILAWHGMGSTVAEVFGEISAKADVVLEVARRRGIDPGQVLFVDDNLTNALRVGQVGAAARWAQWGYQTPEHRRAAAQAGVVPLLLDDLGELVPAGRRA